MGKPVLRTDVRNVGSSATTRILDAVRRLPVIPVDTRIAATATQRSLDHVGSIFLEEPVTLKNLVALCTERTAAFLDFKVRVEGIAFGFWRNPLPILGIGSAKVFGAPSHLFPSAPMLTWTPAHWVTTVAVCLEPQIRDQLEEGRYTVRGKASVAEAAQILADLVVLAEVAGQTGHRAGRYKTIAYIVPTRRRDTPYLGLVLEDMDRSAVPRNLHINLYTGNLESRFTTFFNEKEYYEVLTTSSLWNVMLGVAASRIEAIVNQWVSRLWKATVAVFSYS